MSAGATLTLCDCGSEGKIIVGNESFAEDSAIIKIENGDIFNMNGGIISGNTANFGGGVYVDSIFKMTGGTISDNIASNRYASNDNIPEGGGVFVYPDGKFIVSDVKIEGNYRKDLNNQDIADNVFPAEIETSPIIPIIQIKPSTTLNPATGKIGITSDKQLTDDDNMVLVVEGEGIIADKFISDDDERDIILKDNGIYLSLTPQPKFDLCNDNEIIFSSTPPVGLK